MVAAMDVPDCDGVEFDVQASLDGIPVLLHDASLARVQGVAAARHRADGAPELGRRTGCRRWPRSWPRLPRRAFLDVELKADIGRAVVEVLAAGRGADLQRAVISSFEVPARRARIRGLAPAWPCWLNTDHLRPGDVRIARELGCVGISVEAGSRITPCPPPGPPGSRLPPGRSPDGRSSAGSSSSGSPRSASRALALLE